MIGALVEQARERAGVAVIKVVEPATGQVMAEVEQADAERTDEAVARARRRTPPGGVSPPRIGHS